MNDPHDDKPETPSDDTLSFMVERGVELMREGKLDAALDEWRCVLDRKPDHPQAKEYIQHVEKNYETLMLTKPYPVEADEYDTFSLEEFASDSGDVGDLDDDYETVELGISETEGSFADDLDDGWNLETLQANRPKKWPVDEEGFAGDPTYASEIPESARQHLLAHTANDILSSIEPSVARGVSDSNTESFRQTGEATRGGIGASLASSIELLRLEVERELDETLPPGTDDGAIRERLQWLIDKAKNACTAGEYSLAVVVLELALSEHADSAVAHKTIHTHLDSLLEMYRRCLGATAGVPHLNVPLTELAAYDLESRSAFLASRVDGLMTVEDILDISGMSRLEAYRYLCLLLLRGFITIR